MKEQQTKKKINIAYIDAANLDQALKKTLLWDLDYKKFRIWLTEKYHIERAYVFIGLIPKYKDLYTYLQKCGFTLVFKEVTYKDDGVPKGNCDSDFILQAASDFYEENLSEAVLVTSDGDYASLVKMLQSKNCLKIILSPSPAEKCSILLKRTNAPIAYINDQRHNLELKNKKSSLK